MENRTRKIKNVFYCFLLGILGAILFTLPNPNYIFKNGLPFLAWIMYVPLFFLIKKTTFKSVWFFTGLYGTFSVALYAYWLYNYNPLCFYVALAIAFAGTALLGLALKGVQKLFPKNDWLMLFLLLCSFDYLRTLGFLGMHYGLAAYTQWNFNLLLQSTDLAGVFFLNAFVIFSSALVYAFVSKILDKKAIGHKMIADNTLYEGDTYINYVSENERELEKTSLKLPVVFLCIWIAVFCSLLIYGKIKISKEPEYKTVTVAAIQHNEAPEANGIENYNESIHTLINLTEEALEMNPNIKVVIWPETAVVPSVMYNYEQPEESSRKKLINYLLNYINSRYPYFIIGNQHIEVNKTGKNKKYFNTALMFEPGRNVIPPNPQINIKNRLVPFSEYFPYQKYFPHIYKALLEHEKFFWEQGSDITIFDAAGLSIYAPICFENTFPDLCRLAAQKGAGCFFCLVNDSWSKSEACQIQHLAMAKFRAVENHVPVAVSSVSGQTAFIDQNGIITAMTIPFSKTYAIAAVPVMPKDQKMTIYNKTGDFFGYGALFLFTILLIIQVIIVIIKKIRKRK